jgi:hypothetical protein
MDGVTTIYLLSHTTYFNDLCEGYATGEEDLKQFAINEYWGLLTEAEGLTVEVNISLGWVRVYKDGDMAQEYTIFEFERVQP